MSGSCSTNEIKIAYNILVGKPERSEQLERPMHGREDNIRMDLREIGWEGVWTGCIWLRIGTSGRPL
jgi:hypothetical protein